MRSIKNKQVTHREKNPEKKRKMEESCKDERVVNIVWEKEL